MYSLLKEPYSNCAKKITLVFCNPHEMLLGIQRVSNPSTGNKRISTPAHCEWYKSEKHVSSEFMVYIKQKTGYGVETPLLRSFLGGQEPYLSRALWQKKYFQP